ncbi:MAG TPA: hypothetical protein VGK97_00150 [Spongiibacteraceae bacterium]|jgi:hypothetical protein
MTELIWLSLALLALAAVIFQMRKRKRGNQQVNAQNSQIKTYPAVGIRYHLLACNAVQPLYGKRFLATEAPALPVAGCNVRPCPCRYIHFVDRRTEDRRAQYGIHKNLIAGVGAERRRSDRRRTPAMA